MSDKETLAALADVERQRANEAQQTADALARRGEALSVALRRAEVALEAWQAGKEFTAVLGRLDTLSALVAENSRLVREMASGLADLAANYDTTEGARREMDQQRTIEKQRQVIRAAGDTIRALRDGRDLPHLFGEVNAALEKIHYTRPA